MGSTPSSFHLSSPAHSLPFCFNFLLQRMGTNSQHPSEQSRHRIYLKKPALCYHSNQNFKMIQLNSKLACHQHDTREQMSCTITAIGVAAWGIIQNCLIFTGLMSYSWIWSCMTILHLFQPCALWFCSWHAGCYVNAVQLPVHKVLLAAIWGIINRGCCRNPGESVPSLEMCLRDWHIMPICFLIPSISSHSLPFSHTVCLCTCFFPHSLSLLALTLSSSPLGIGDVTAGSACPPLRQQQSPVALTNLI